MARNNFWEKRRYLIEQVEPVVVDHPPETLNMKEIARASNVKLWQLRAYFGDVQDVFKQVALHLIDKVCEALPVPGAEEPRVLDAIDDYVTRVSDLTASPVYARLLGFVIRNSHSHPWLVELYRSRISSRLSENLEAAIRATGQRGGLDVLLHEKAKTAWLRRLEAQAALACIYPKETYAAETHGPLCGQIVKELFSATYALNGR